MFLNYRKNQPTGQHYMKSKLQNKQDTREMLVSGNVFKTMLTLSVPELQL